MHWFGLHLRDQKLEISGTWGGGRVILDGRGATLFRPIRRTPLHLSWGQDGWRIGRQRNGVVVYLDRSFGVWSVMRLLPVAGARTADAVTVYPGAARGVFAAAMDAFGMYLPATPAAQIGLDDPSRCERLVAALATLRQEPDTGWPFDLLTENRS